MWGPQTLCFLVKKNPMKTQDYGYLRTMTINHSDVGVINAPTERDLDRGVILTLVIPNPHQSPMQVADSQACPRGLLVGCTRPGKRLQKNELENPPMPRKMGKSTISTGPWLQYMPGISHCWCPHYVNRKKKQTIHPWWSIPEVFDQSPLEPLLLRLNQWLSIICWGLYPKTIALKYLKYTYPREKYTMFWQYWSDNLKLFFCVGYMIDFDKIHHV